MSRTSRKGKEEKQEGAQWEWENREEKNTQNHSMNIVLNKLCALCVVVVDVLGKS